MQMGEDLGDAGCGNHGGLISSLFQALCCFGATAAQRRVGTRPSARKSLKIAADVKIISKTHATLYLRHGDQGLKQVRALNHVYRSATICRDFRHVFKGTE